MDNLDPHSDWRITAERVKDWPRCFNCGDAYGNVAFGASHFCKKGYTPATQGFLEVDGEIYGALMRIYPTPT